MQNTRQYGYQRVSTKEQHADRQLQALLDAGAKEVYAACTHGVLSGPAIERIQNSCLKEMIITNTIKLADEKKIDKITVLSVGTLLGHGILRILSDEPLSGLFTYSYDKSKRELL